MDLNVKVLMEAEKVLGVSGMIKLLSSRKHKFTHTQFINNLIDNANKQEAISFNLSPIIFWEEGVPKLKFHLSDFIVFLANNEIDARNIRKCAFCPKIFWARREDQEACTTECGKPHRSKLHAVKNREQINKNRRKNRERERKKGQQNK